MLIAITYGRDGDCSDLDCVVSLHLQVRVEKHQRLQPSTFLCFFEAYCMKKDRREGGKEGRKKRARGKREEVRKEKRNRERGKRRRKGRKKKRKGNLMPVVQ